MKKERIAMAVIGTMLLFGFAVLMAYLSKHTKYLWLLVFCAVSVGVPILLGGNDNNDEE